MDLYPLHELTDRILRCVVAVHKELGPALPERSYEIALGLEMTAQQLAFERRPAFVIRYRDAVVGRHCPDFIVEGKVVVEIKSVGNLDPVFAKQVLTYLKVTKLRVGLLINFNVASMGKDGIRRFVL
jgi:GxxExxY protein